MRPVVASAAKAEDSGILHHGKTDIPLRITPNELGFTLSPTPIKTDNSSAEGIITTTVRQRYTRQGI